MATYTIAVTAFEYSEADNVENPEKAYDSSASTYATVDMGDANEHVYLYAFDFSKIPQGEVVTSITAKVKSCGSCNLGDCLVWLQSTADSSGVKLSADMTPTTSVSIKTLSLTADVSTIMSYANTLSVAFSHGGLNATFDIYAVYFTVTTSVVKPNKVIYGNETLIDLTGDTATASDVAVGKTFHLASGLQATGTLSPTMKTKTAASSKQSISFSGLSSAPEMFALVPTDAPAAPTSSRQKVLALSYDGSTKYALIGTTKSSPYRIESNFSHTYTSGTLTITFSSSTSFYFGEVSYKLFYL